MNNNESVDEEAKELMRQYYASLMAAPPEPGVKTTHPAYSPQELGSPEFAEVNRRRQTVGLPPISNRSGRRIQTAISLTEDEVEALRLLAAEWGYMHGGRGNLSAFLAAIALGDLVITPRYGT